MRLALALALALPCAAQAQAPAFDWDALIGPALSDVAKDAAKRTAFYSAEELYRLNRRDIVSYVIGVVDGDYSLGGNPNHTYCLPSGVSVGQVVDVAWRYLEQNPKDRHFGAAYMVRRGLTDAWPCGK